MNADVAIIICAHNPDEQVFRLTLAAVSRLSVPVGLTVECVLVDNCSVPALRERGDVARFLAATPWASIIIESKPGLTHARLAGIHSTTAPFVVFIDDDNVPAEDYLEAAVNCLNDHPDIFALGPGNVSVRFLGQVSAEFVADYSGVFQARHSQTLEYACIPGAQLTCYPFGTGLILRRSVVDQYSSAVMNGTLSSVDRQGRRLSSGGDTQIVWEAIKLGGAAGISPALGIVHTVAATRSNPDYVARVLYGTASSYLPAFFQSFPEFARRLHLPDVRMSAVVRMLFRVTARCFVRRRWKFVRAEMAKILGPIAGQLKVQNREPTKWFLFLVRRLGLE